jgi:hypothetical protein
MNQAQTARLCGSIISGRCCVRSSKSSFELSNYIGREMTDVLKILEKTIS